ncbi:hypothetical protein [Spiroplasma taiwanense]|uniref:DUF4064 domain-containing protein n=1 Tax=Spiroplasma taiwanense CT-1 TaxID=1276220 RepID=S5LUA8_9MOLU|nr:hypothetical protein [Spiroplasma taiwanense]AGR41354.1 hypothetical protein STAIW_v1c07450 [Spiroplasma taiwanense CT-1]
MNGLAKGGIITNFVGTALAALISIILLIASLLTTSTLPIAGGIIIIFTIISLISSILIIIFGALALAKGNNKFKITTGIIGIISILFNWIAYFFVAIIILVGSILTLCGKAKN